MRTTLFRFAAICALIAGVVTSGVAASADNTNPNGAQALNFHGCFDLGGAMAGYTDCEDAHLTIQNLDLAGPPARNPAGNASVTVNGHQCSTLTDPSGAVVSSDCQEVHQHILLLGATDQEAQFALKRTEVTPIGTFCVTSIVHEIDGQVLFNHTSSGAC